jgi:hypothetical protein
MKGSSPIFIEIDHCDPFSMVPFSEIHLLSKYIHPDENYSFY